METSPESGMHSWEGFSFDLGLRKGRSDGTENILTPMWLCVVCVFDSESFVRVPFFWGGGTSFYWYSKHIFNFWNLLEVLVSGLEIPWIRLDGGIFVELNIWFPFNMNYLILLWIHPKSWTARPWKMMAKEDDPFLLGPDGQLSGASFISFRVYSYLNIQGPNYIYIYITPPYESPMSHRHLRHLRSAGRARCWLALESVGRAEGLDGRCPTWNPPLCCWKGPKINHQFSPVVSGIT